MRTNCVTTSEATSPGRAGGLVRTHETVAMFKVGVPVPLDLPEVRVPVVTVSNPAENGLLPAEVGDGPKIAVVVIAAVSFINAIPPVAILEDSAACARLKSRHRPDTLNRHLGGVLIRRSPKSAEKDGSTYAFLMPFRNTGRWRNGT